MKQIVFLLIALLYISNYGYSQLPTKDSISAINSILEFQKELKEQYADTAESPLPDEAVGSFKGHEFFDIDLKYRVQADLVLTLDSPIFEMPTTTSRKPKYRQYAIAVFTIDNVEYRLALYQSQSLMENEEYKDYLFIPFKDYTNGVETYGGGRYIDLRIPEGDKIIIDFNQAYNPYCAYSVRYSCPIPPDQNHLPVEIRAGIKYKDDYHDK